MLESERAREGAALKRDFDARIKRLAAALPRIEKLANESRAAIRANFETRVRELLAELPINERRLLDEAANAAQHGDITEEMTRLSVHLKALEGAKSAATGQSANRSNSCSRRSIARSTRWGRSRRPPRCRKLRSK